jgi:hypothetical protein
MSAEEKRLPFDVCIKLIQRFFYHRKSSVCAFRLWNLQNEYFKGFSPELKKFKPSLFSKAHALKVLCFPLFLFLFYSLFIFLLFLGFFGLLLVFFGFVELTSSWLCFLAIAGLCQRLSMLVNVSH